MSERLVKCVICGKEFTTNRTNAKYCGDECRNKGRRSKRKEWEKKTGYTIKQCEKMRKKRESIKAEKNIREMEKEKEKRKQKEINEKRNRTRLLNDKICLLTESYNQGNPLDGMILAKMLYGNKNSEYWEAFKRYEMQQADVTGDKCTTNVNGIPITDKNFSLSVCISIEELGSIFIKKSVH